MQICVQESGNVLVKQKCVNFGSSSYIRRRRQNCYFKYTLYIKNLSIALVFFIHKKVIYFYVQKKYKMKYLLLVKQFQTRKLIEKIEDPVFFFLRFPITSKE